MTTNFNDPVIVIFEATRTINSDERADFFLPREVDIIRNFYSIGGVQLQWVVDVAARVAPTANIGSVLEESVIRREVGTWHRERGGSVTARGKIEHLNQALDWQGKYYPLERNDAADPGWYVPREEIGLDMILDSDVPVKAYVPSLTPRVRTNEAGAQVIEPAVPQYLIERGCWRTKIDTQRITLNRFDPPNYRSLDKLVVSLDEDKFTIRSYPGVELAIEIQAFIVIASESRSTTEIRGGGNFGVCLPALPVYAPVIEDVGRG